MRSWRSARRPGCRPSRPSAATTSCTSNTCSRRTRARTSTSWSAAAAPPSRVIPTESPPVVRQQRFPLCARIGVFTALAPALFGVAMAMIKPFLIPDDCERAYGVVLCGPNHPQINLLTSIEILIPLLSWVTIPLGIVLFLVCRRYRRDLEDAPLVQSPPPADVPPSGESPSSGSR